MMYCEKCSRIFDGERCPACNSRKVRAPEPTDTCFLTERDYVSSGILEDVLRQSGIPFLKKQVMGAGLAIKVGPMLDRSRFYVLFPQLERTEEIVEELFSAVRNDGEDTADENEEE